MIVVDEVRHAQPEALALLTRLAGQLGADQRLLLIGRAVPAAAFEPRFTSGKHKGQCNANANPLAKGAVATFLAAGVLTVNG